MDLVPIAISQRKDYCMFQTLTMTINSVFISSVDYQELESMSKTNMISSNKPEPSVKNK